jgi:hypothetical protein
MKRLLSIDNKTPQRDQKAKLRGKRGEYKTPVAWHNANYRGKEVIDLFCEINPQQDLLISTLEWCLSYLNLSIFKYP